VILGSGFSPVFADVILIANAVILSVVLLAVFLNAIPAICAKILERALAVRAFLMAHLSPRHR
jgi:hypothetical protein